MQFPVEYDKTAVYTGLSSFLHNTFIHREQKLPQNQFRKENGILNVLDENPAENQIKYTPQENNNNYLQATFQIPANANDTLIEKENEMKKLGNSVHFPGEFDKFRPMITVLDKRNSTKF